MESLDGEVDSADLVAAGKFSGRRDYLWWAAASAVQLTWGIAVYRKGYAGHPRVIPFKAFAVASLFVGAGATAVCSTLSASGINSVQFSLLLFY